MSAQILKFPFTRPDWLALSAGRGFACAACDNNGCSYCEREELNRLNAMTDAIHDCYYINDNKTTPQILSDACRSVIPDATQDEIVAAIMWLDRKYADRTRQDGAA